MKTDAIVFIELSGQTVPAGKLSIVEDGRYSRASFAYGRRYLERPDAVALDPVQMPLASRVLHTEQDFGLFNGLRDASPDAWGRKIIDAHFPRIASRAPMESDYLLLSRSGTRSGALSFGPTPDGPGPVLPWHIPGEQVMLGDLGALIDLADRIGDESEIPKHLLPYIGPATDMGGARPKATVMIDGFPWLAKFPGAHDRIDMAAAEAGCLDLCKMAGIPSCERRIEKIGDRRVLLLKRFDREERETCISRIPMISGLTMLGAHEYDRGTSGYADIHDAIRRHGVAAGAGEDLYRRMVMNVLCGNTDDHYRNHGFLLDDKGRWDMSPVYDVTPTLQTSTSRNLFLHLGKAGSGREATLDAAIAAGPSLGIDPDHARDIAEELALMVNSLWSRTMENRGASDFDILLMENSFSEADRRGDHDIGMCFEA